MLRILRTAISILHNNGPSGFARSVYKFTKNRARRARWRVQYHPNAVPREDEILLVDPSAVDHVLWWNDLRQYFGNVPEYGIESGTWDKNARDFESTYKYQSLVEHFVEGRPWEETDYYQRIVDTEKFDYVDDPVNFLSQYDRLFESIQEEGYQDLHPVVLNVGREGQLIRHNGAHRLTIARILGIDSVPARILIRHQRWQEIRNRVARTDSIDELPKEVRDDLDHPDLRDVRPT